VGVDSPQLSNASRSGHPAREHHPRGMSVQAAPPLVDASPRAVWPVHPNEPLIWEGLTADT
jgi:hypothetical protein